jgi:Tol biopolymer transport system component
LITFAAFAGANGLPASTGLAREIFVANPDGSGIRRLTHSGGSKSFPVWSPDGLQIAYAVEDDASLGATSTLGWLEVVSVATGESRRVAYFDASKLVDRFTLAWAPDSTRLAFSDSRGLHEVRLTDSQSSPETLATKAYWPSWSPDGSTLAYVRSDGLWVVGAGNNRRLILHDDTTYRPIWLADDRIAYAGRDGLVSISSDGTGQRVIAGGLADPLSWEFSPDRDLVAVVRPTGDLWIMGADGSNSRLLRPGVQGHRLVWSPDGSLIACEVARDIVFLSVTDGSVASRLSTDEDPDWWDWGLGWSP